MDWSTILGVADGALTGGIFGLIGTLIHAGLKAWDQHQTVKKELAHREYDLRELALEHKLQMGLEEKRLEGMAAANAHQRALTEELVAGEIRQASYANDRATYTQQLGGGWSGSVARFLLAVVDVVRGIMRPAITIAMLWLLWEISQRLEIITGGQLSGDQAEVLWLQIVTAIITLATTCVTWWFGSRQLREGR